MRSLLLVMLLSMLFTALFAVPAWADDVSEARAELVAAETRMTELTQEYTNLKASADTLQTEIDAIAAEALAVQAAMLEGRDALVVAAQYEYRGMETQSLLQLIFSAESFSDLIRNLAYLESIKQFCVDEVDAQRLRMAELNRITDELNAKRDVQEANLRALDQKRQEAAVLVDRARTNLSIAEAEAERLAELERLESEMAGSQGGVSSAPDSPGAAGEGSVGDGAGSDEEIRDENANTPDREDAVKPDTPVQPDPEPDPGASSATGWQTGIASAYGGETDEWTPNPGTTATGDVCDDYSMGVAVPMAWPQYWKYYGRTVEISYNGMTVFAVVNDCGYMGGGSRVLDLQPGVWKAFGFTSCNSWGLRTVSYRFL